MPARPIGERAMTDAECQARYRAARATGTPVIRTRHPADHRSRARRWDDTVAELTKLHAECVAWLQNRGARNDIFRSRMTSLDPFLVQLETAWSGGSRTALRSGGP